MTSITNLPSQLAYDCLKSPEMIGLYKLLEENKFIVKGFGFGVPKTIFTLLKKVTDKEGYTIRLRTVSLPILGSKISFKTMCISHDSTPVVFFGRHEGGFSILSYNKAPGKEVLGSAFLEILQDEESKLNHPVFSGLAALTPGKSTQERFYEELRALVIDGCHYTEFGAGFAPVEDIIASNLYQLDGMSSGKDLKDEWASVMEVYGLPKDEPLKLRQMTSTASQRFKEYPSGISLVQEIDSVHGYVTTTQSEILGFYDVCKKTGKLTLSLRPIQP